MELLILALLGALTAGVGLWAARGERPAEDGKDDDGESRGGGPRSSPELPEANRDAGAAEAGKAVVLGGSRPGEELRAALQRAPEQIRPDVVPGATIEEALQKTKAQRTRRRPLKVTYDADGLIGRASRHAHHRRALLNADTLVEKQKGEEALAVYERVQRRVNDEEIQSRIQVNVDDIKRWLSGADVEDETLQFPEIIIPLTTQAIALENLSQGLRTISEGLVQQIGQVLQQPIPVSISGSVGLGAAPGAPVAGAPTVGALPAAPASAAAPTAFAPGFAPQPAIPGMGEIVAVTVSDLLQQAREGAVGDAAMPPGFEVDEQGRLLTDGWSDQDFEREWEKFKHLPLKDRRSGLERRTQPDRRREKDPDRKDRRGGFDRRKRDLFKEREDFLNKLARHKERKKQLEEWKKKQEEEKPPEKPLFRIPVEATLKPIEALPEEEPPEIETEIAAPEPEEEEPEEIPAPPQPPEEEPTPEEAVAEAEEEPAPAPEKPEEPPEEAEKGPARTELIPPELIAVGMPSADDPYFAGGAMAAAAQEGGAGGGAAEGGAPPEMAAEELEEGPELPEIELPEEEKKPPPQEIHGILELKPPEEDDAPFLTLTYDFSKIPDSFKLSRDYHTMEYAYYKYKPMLIKAQEFTRRKMLKNALNYYRVIKSQNIPPEFKRMINRNIMDITEYLEKFLMRRG